MSEQVISGLLDRINPTPSLRTQLAEKEAEAAVMREALVNVLEKLKWRHGEPHKVGSGCPTCDAQHQSKEALLSSAGKTYLARMEEAVRLLSEISPAAFASTSNPSNWLKRRDAILEQLKGTKANE